MDAIVEENISMVKLKETNDNIARYGSTAKTSGQIIRRRTARNRIHQTNDSTATTNNTDGSTSDATATVAVMENGNRAVDKEQAYITSISWRRILLLIIAVTVHNIPEGLAVGVAFGMLWFYWENI
ncbi:unnamed protein product [Brugia timori]|uniref:Uncharacterized protein n=1 Tax=Brugia timori TaxID=42155 RepID=A0A3P7TMF2_9BILA|nr:unnamed protein product [Brugia timori]